MNRIICFIKGHLWIEWEHCNQRPRKEFIKGTVILKNPECVRCGIRKH